ncbi:MAG: hypothetical protein ABIG89_00905 [Candidatus Woesearchaeota archaeon]
MKKKILKLISEIEELERNKPDDLNSDDSNISKDKLMLASDRFDFKALKSSNHERLMKVKTEQLKELIFEAGADYKKNKNKHNLFVELFGLINTFDDENNNDSKQNLSKINTIKNIIIQLNLTESITSALNITIPSSTSNIPNDIKEEISLDIRELNNAFNANCYRASIILCGRIVETCLHRKYYEETGVDMLEKSPGIGLGNLIAKMRDKGITFDPGLTQQIHLLNNVRIFSVHKKKELFIPSKQQTYASILYTMDIVERLF